MATAWGRRTEHSLLAEPGMPAAGTHTLIPRERTPSHTQAPACTRPCTQPGCHLPAVWPCPGPYPLSACASLLFFSLQDVMSTSPCRRPEAPSGTYSTGEAPSKTAVLVLTADRREDPCFSLVRGCRASKCCWWGEVHRQEEDTQGLLGRKEDFICTEGSVSRISVAFWKKLTGRELFLCSLSTTGELHQHSAWGVFPWLYLGSLPQDSVGSTEAVHGGCPGRQSLAGQKGPHK